MNEDEIKEELRKLRIELLALKERLNMLEECQCDSCKSKLRQRLDSKDWLILGG